jgi:hypothetical protein
MSAKERSVWNWTETRKVEILASDRVCCGEEVCAT